MGGAHLPDSPVEYLWGRDRRQSAVVGIADRLADCEDFLSRYTNHFRTSFHMGSSNPKVRDRVNCVNAKLCSQARSRTLFIDPRCKQLIQDLERVQWKQDANGNMLHEMDKSDPARTHVSDALGYMISREFGMRPAGGYRSERIL